MNAPRLILEFAVRQFPPERAETGRALEAELLEMRGLEALQWALGGVKLAVIWNGGNIMKTLGYWVAVLAVSISAGWLYTNGNGWLAFALIALGLGLSVYARPGNAIPTVLVFGSSLFLAQLLWFYSAFYTILRALAKDDTNSRLEFGDGQLMGMFKLLNPPPTERLSIVQALGQLLPPGEILALCLVAAAGLLVGWLFHSSLKSKRQRSNV